VEKGVSLQVRERYNDRKEAEGRIEKRYERGKVNEPGRTRETELLLGHAVESCMALVTRIDSF